MFNDKLDMNSFPKQSSRIPKEMQIDRREHSTDREMTSPCQVYQKREVKLLIIFFPGTPKWFNIVAIIPLQKLITTGKEYFDVQINVVVCVEPMQIQFAASANAACCLCEWSL